MVLFDCNAVSIQLLSVLFFFLYYKNLHLSYAVTRLFTLYIFTASLIIIKNNLHLNFTKYVEDFPRAQEIYPLYNQCKLTKGIFIPTIKEDEEYIEFVILFVTQKYTKVQKK